MKSYKDFFNENVSKEDAKRVRRMMDASPEQARSLQGELESSREAARRISSGETRTSKSGQRTRTRPSARVGGAEVDASDAAAARQSGRVRTGTNTPLSDQPKADTAALTPEKKAEVEKFRSKPSEPSVGRGEARRAAALNQAMKDGANTPSASPRSRGGDILDKLTGRTTRTRSSGVSQAEVSKQQAAYRTAQGEKAYQAKKLDQDVRRAFPTKKGGLRADELNPYVKKQVRIDRANKLGVPDPFDPKASKAPSRPFKSIIKSQPSAPTKPVVPDPFKTGSAPAKIKRATSGAPDRTALKQVVADIRSAQARQVARSYDIKATSVPKTFGNRLKKTVTPVTKPAVPKTVKQKATAEKVFQALKTGKSDQYRGYAQTGVGPKGQILGKVDRKYYQQLSKTPFGIEKYKAPTAPLTGKGGALDIPQPSKAIQPSRAQTLAQTKIRKSQQIAARAATPAAQGAKQAAVAKKFYKVGGFKTGAGALAGLAGYGAYKQEKARGASERRATIRGAVKGTGAYLGAKGGFKLAQMLSKGGSVGKGLAGAVLGFTALGAAADKTFKAFAGATKSEKQRMAAASRATGKAPTKASLRWTSSNPLERFGRTIRQSKIPILSNIADKYYKSRGG